MFRPPCVFRNISLRRSLQLKVPYHFASVPRSATSHLPLKGKVLAGQTTVGLTPLHPHGLIQDSDASFEDAIMSICECGKDVVRTSWTRLNPDRRCCGCPGNGWVDPPMCRRSKEVIPGLLTRLSQEDVVKKALVQVQEVEGVVVRLRRFLVVVLIGWFMTAAALEYNTFRTKTSRHRSCDVSAVKPCALAYRHGPDPHWEALRILFGDEPNDNAHLEAADRNISNLHPRHEVIDVEYSYGTNDSSDTSVHNVH
ncbi:hypothetical protein Salat_1116700 [Sesamum alatum]|uniref:Uncharacterized protein n=1 Tax=Sesamum alatum TaxID=300844 RepID=A0AAE1YN83_9LAMI|nr:hypothetical protein Salat_1116700 [Sesamum alatum]